MENGQEQGMETEPKNVSPAGDPLRDELVITQEVIQGLLEMLGAAWAEVDEMRAANRGVTQSQ